MTTFSIDKANDLEMLENMKESLIEKVKFFERMESKTRTDKQSISKFEEKIREIEDRMITIKRQRLGIKIR